uniref:putative F-box protein At3g58860 n=1 Tax=Erigeron canadensis TaxID=72917 RepID=UPI001CB9993C|nr:putative F-box protein At3g58860 [Erigeron canadensis]
MKEVKRKRRVDRKPELEVPVELIQRIQSLLPLKEAAQTCILSKSWLHAWSTVPTLRFHPSDKYHGRRQQARYIKLIRRTLRRYHRDNIPIESFSLYLSIQDMKSASVAEKWIRRVSSKSCLKKLYLEISVRKGSFMLPDEIFSGENLDTASITADWSLSNILSISSNCVINCVSLRVLKLIEVHVSEEVLNNLLSTCSLLEKVKLSLPEGSRTIKVKNLRYLRKLKIHSKDPNDVLEIHDVPSLRLLSYDSSLAFAWVPRKSLLLNADVLGGVKELSLAGVIMDDSLSDIIKSKFPFLEGLAIDILDCRLEILDITCNSLKRLKIEACEDGMMDVRVYAPSLLFFSYTGLAMPTFLFPAVAPEQIELNLTLQNPVDNSFFLKMRETLDLSRNSIIKLVRDGSVFQVPFNIDIDGLKQSVPFPATNVQELRFSSYPGRIPTWDDSLFCKAMFLICHPIYVKANQIKVNNYFWKRFVNGMIKKKARRKNWPHLKDVEIKSNLNREWETLTSSCIEAHIDWCNIELKLTWCSP